MAKAGRRCKYPDEVYERAVEMRTLGIGIKEIAAALGVTSKGTIHSAIVRLAPHLIVRARQSAVLPRDTCRKQGEKSGGNDARFHEHWTGAKASPVREHVDRLPGSSILLPTPEQLRRGR